MAYLKEATACLLAFCMSWSAHSVVADEPVLAGAASVIDGDTIEIAGQRIRIMDVDAPERGQHCTAADRSLWPCGDAAADALATVMHGKQVSCGTVGKPSRGLQLARCAAEGVDLANWLLAAGWAVPARNCKCEVARDLARLAEAGGHGIWGSAFQLPWDWRVLR
ncbi:MAG: thermonuclease family protein [Rhodospirillaceae bacterium]|nr:thermonuclease family protein [Rhodospirillaceae bacterium]